MPQFECTQSNQSTRSLLRRRLVEARTGLAKSTLYKLIAEGLFPRPIPLTGRAVAWDSQAVDAWINGRCAA